MEPFASVLQGVWEAVWTLSAHSVTSTKHEQALADRTCSHAWGQLQGILSVVISNAGDWTPQICINVLQEMPEDRK